MKLYDNLHFAEKPPSEELGCVHLPSVGAWRMHGGSEVPNKDWSKPNGKYYRQTACEIEDQGETIAYLNLEFWQANPSYSVAESEKRMRNKLMTLALMRDEAPSVEWVAYAWAVGGCARWLDTGQIPLDELWKWHDWNDRFARPVLEAQTAIFPGHYLSKNVNDAKWRERMRSWIKEVQRLVPGKPIYPFIRLRYGSLKQNNLTWIPPERLEMSLKHLRDLGVDGFVLWSLGAEAAQVPWDTPELQELWQVVEEVAK